MATKTFRIYTCKKHPTWSLETSVPVFEAGLKYFCPLCRDEFMERSIGLADCRTETRTVEPAKEKSPLAAPQLPLLKK